MRDCSVEPCGPALAPRCGGGGGSATCKQRRSQGATWPPPNECALTIKAFLHLDGDGGNASRTPAGLGASPEGEGPQSNPQPRYAGPLAHLAPQLKALHGEPGEHRQRQPRDGRSKHERRAEQQRHRALPQDAQGVERAAGRGLGRRGQRRRRGAGGRPLEVRRWASSHG